MKSIFLLTTLWLGLSSADLTIDKSEFCNICNCNNDKKEVICSEKTFVKNINRTEYWFNEEANTSYPFTKVSIQYADLVHILPFPTSTVKYLDLSRNKIELFENGCFKNMQNLTELDLSDNDIVSEILSPDVFSGSYADDEYLPLKSLKVLRMGKNKIHTFHQDMFEHIVNLEILDLNGNPLRVIDTQTLIAITNLRYLRTLDLSYTFLKALPNQMLHTPRNLSNLNLSGNLFTKIPTHQLAESHNLQVLNLNDNPIVNITKEDGFPKLEALKILHMCFMSNLTYIEDGSMSGLWNVEELYISNNPKLLEIGKDALSRYEGEVEVKTWPLVKKLDISKNNLSYLSHETLSRWDALTDVDITDNPWICDCKNEWLLQSLVKFVVAKNDTHRHKLYCGGPPEMMGQTFEEILTNHDAEYMRCSDLNGARPEKDASMLIGLLVGLLVGVPVIVGLYICYKKEFFGVFSSSPAAFSRKFYNPANDDEEFYS